MAFGLDDFANWLYGVAGTFRGENVSRPGGRNVQEGVVQPLKDLSEYTGLTQMYKGSLPNASNVDRGLALLNLAGLLSGQESAMGLYNNIDSVGAVSKNIANSLQEARPSSKRIYGIHMSPKSGLKSIDISKGAKKGVASKNWEDSIDGVNYFFNMDNIDDTKLNQLKSYFDAYYTKRKMPISMYYVRAPRKGSFTDLNDMFVDTHSRAQQLSMLLDDLPYAVSESDSKLRNYLDGQMYNKKPLKVLKEAKLNNPATGVATEKDLVEAMSGFNSKNPNANKYNSEIIKRWGKWLDSH